MRLESLAWRLLAWALGDAWLWERSPRYRQCVYFEVMDTVVRRIARSQGRGPERVWEEVMEGFRALGRGAEGGRDGR